MKKQTEVIKQIAAKSGLTIKQVKSFLTAQAELAKADLKETGVYTLYGMGKMKAKDVPARTGRNPKNGQPVEIKASRRISLKPSKDLKVSV